MVIQGSDSNATWRLSSLSSVCGRLSLTIAGPLGAVHQHMLNTKKSKRLESCGQRRPLGRANMPIGSKGGTNARWESIFKDTYMPARAWSTRIKSYKPVKRGNKRGKAGSSAATLSRSNYSIRGELGHPTG